MGLELRQVEDECIERLLQESEEKGLEQRRDWAKRQCIEGDASHVAVTAARGRCGLRVGVAREWAPFS